MTEKQESESKDRLKKSITLLIDALSLIRDIRKPDDKRADKLEQKIKNFLKAPT
jgi:hypothetical protein